MKTSNYATLIPQSKRAIEHVIRKHGSMAQYSGNTNTMYFYPNTKIRGGYLFDLLMCIDTDIKIELTTKNKL